jgi:coenzyme PQQ precursor peptide PqqA
MAAAPAIAATETKATPDELAIVKKARAYMWSTPRIDAIAVGLEINAYACADLT